MLLDDFWESGRSSCRMWVWTKPWRMSRNWKVAKREMRRAFHIQGLACGPGDHKYQLHLERFWVGRSASGQEICILTKQVKWFWCVAIFGCPCLHWTGITCPTRFSHTYCPGGSSGPSGPSTASSPASGMWDAKLDKSGPLGLYTRRFGEKLSRFPLKHYAEMI